MKAIKLSILFFPILLFAGCSYKYVLLKDIEGKYFWTKEYKDFERQQIYLLENIFNYSSSKPYYGYKGKISTDTIHNLNYYQFDSVKIFLYLSNTEVIRPLFSSGLLSSELIYCHYDSTCKSFLDPDTTFNKYEFEYLKTQGYSIKIELVEELKIPTTPPTKRRFRLWVNPGKMSYFHRKDLFYLEITNDNVLNNNLPLAEFVKGARVTLFEHHGMVI